MHVFTSITDLRWANDDRTRASGTVTIEGYGDEKLPFGFDITDPVLGNEEERSALFADFEAGKYGPVAPYVAPPPAPYVPIVIPSAVFFERMSGEEAEELDGAMMAKPVRVRSAWAGVVNQGRDVREDQPLLWDALRAEIVAQFGDAKATEWLARPTPA